MMPVVYSGGCACQCRRHETQVRSLSREDPLEEGIATHSSILAWRSPWTEDWRATVRGVAKNHTGLKQLSTHVHIVHL